MAFFNLLQRPKATTTISTTAGVNNSIPTSTADNTTTTTATATNSSTAAETATSTTAPSSPPSPATSKVDTTVTTANTPVAVTATTIDEIPKNKEVQETRKNEGLSSIPVSASAAAASSSSQPPFTTLAEGIAAEEDYFMSVSSSNQNSNTPFQRSSSNTTTSTAVTSTAPPPPPPPPPALTDIIPVVPAGSHLQSKKKAPVPAVAAATAAVATTTAVVPVTMSSRRIRTRSTTAVARTTATAAVTKHTTTPMMTNVASLPTSTPTKKSKTKNVSSQSSSSRTLKKPPSSTTATKISQTKKVSSKSSSSRTVKKSSSTSSSSPKKKRSATSEEGKTAPQKRRKMTPTSARNTNTTTAATNTHQQQQQQQRYYTFNISQTPSLPCVYCQLMTHPTDMIILKPCGCNICHHCYVQWMIIKPQQQHKSRQHDQQQQCCYYCRIHSKIRIKLSLHPIRSPSPPRIQVPTTTTTATPRAKNRRKITNNATMTFTSAHHRPPASSNNTITLVEHIYNSIPQEEDEQSIAEEEEGGEEKERIPRPVIETIEAQARVAARAYAMSGVQRPINLSPPPLPPEEKQVVNPVDIETRKAQARAYALAGVQPPTNPSPPDVAVEEQQDNEKKKNNNNNDSNNMEEEEDYSKEEEEQFRKYYYFYYNQSLPRYIHLTIKERVQLLLGFYMEHGHFNIPMNSSSISNKRLRVHYHNIQSGRTKVTENDKQRLIDKGFQFEPTRPPDEVQKEQEQFQRRYLLANQEPLSQEEYIYLTPKECVHVLLDFHSKYGHYKIPQDTNRNKLLYEYCYNIRWGIIKLDDGDKKLLADSGLIFQILRKTFDQRFIEYCDYKRNHPGKNIPVQSSLGKWVASIRTGHIKITDTQRQRLDDVNFRWTVKDLEQAWNDRLDELKAYKVQYGDTCIPYDWPENKQLSSWVHYQRKLFLKNELRPDRIQALKDIDFAWHGKQGKRNRQWPQAKAKAIENAKKWVAEYNHKRNGGIPATTTTTTVKRKSSGPNIKAETSMSIASMLQHFHRRGSFKTATVWKDIGASSNLKNKDALKCVLELVDLLITPKERQILMAAMTNNDAGTGSSDGEIVSSEELKTCTECISKKCMDKMYVYEGMDPENPTGYQKFPTYESLGRRLRNYKTVLGKLNGQADPPLQDRPVLPLVSNMNNGGNGETATTPTTERTVATTRTIPSLVPTANGGGGGGGPTPSAKAIADAKKWIANYHKTSQV